MPALLGAKRFAPSLALDLFAKLANTLVVLLCDEGLAVCERAVAQYMLLHRWALRVLDEWPELRPLLRARLAAFLPRAPAGATAKQEVPALGEWYPPQAGCIRGSTSDPCMMVLI